MGQKMNFINCTSCNGSPQLIPFQFANGKLPHSYCRAFWAMISQSFSNFILQIDVGKLSEYVIPMGGGLDIPPNFYILLPCILTALCLPLVITRAVMMDLDCFVFKKSQLFVQTEKYVESQHQLPKILQKNVNSKKVTCRLNIVLLCSTFVNFIVVLLLILFGILIFVVLR